MLEQRRVQVMERIRDGDEDRSEERINENSHGHQLCHNKRII